jgi:DNA-binding CsgD family transcriptional regulator
MRDQIAAFNRACDVAHSLAVGTASWHELVREASTFLGTDGVCYMLFDKSTGEMVGGAEVGYDEKCQTDYRSHYHQFDGTKRRQWLAPAGSWFETSADGKADDARDQVYRSEFLKPHRIALASGFIIRNDERWHSALSSRRSARTRWSLEDRARIETFVGLIVKAAVSLEQRTDDAVMLLANMLDPKREAYCVVLPPATVIHSAAGVDTFFSGRNELVLADNVLAHRDPRRNTQLRAQIAAASAQGSAAVVLPNGWGCSYRLTMRRLPNTNPFGLKIAVGVRIEAHNIFDVPSADLLRDVFGFTEAEARIAYHLVGGLTAADCAQVLGVSVATVRKQVAAVLLKTGCNRQAELIRLVSGLR